MKTQFQFYHSKKPEDPKQLQLFIDDELWKEFSRRIIQPHLSDLKNCATLQEFYARFDEAEKKMAKEEALRLLSYKGRFEKELRDKLRTQNFSLSAIEFAVKECIRLGYINDFEEGKKQVRHYLSRGYGPKRIAAQLKMQCPQHQHSLLKESLLEQNKSIEKVIFKLCKNVDLKNTKEKQKVIRALLRRGFDFDLIERTLREDRHHWD